MVWRELRYTVLLNSACLACSRECNVSMLPNGKDAIDATIHHFEKPGVQLHLFVFSRGERTPPMRVSCRVTYYTFSDVFFTMDQLRQHEEGLILAMIIYHRFGIWGSSENRRSRVPIALPQTPL